MRKMTVAFAVLIAGLASPAFADKAEGLWLTGPDKKGQVGHIRMSRCGDALCGKVLKAFDKNGKSVQTRNVGKQVIWGVKPTGDSDYAGTMYVSTFDKNVKGRFLVSGRSMVVKGCLGPVCQSQTWKKID